LVKLKNRDNSSWWAKKSLLINRPKPPAFPKLQAAGWTFAAKRFSVAAGEKGESSIF